MRRDRAAGVVRGLVISFPLDSCSWYCATRLRLPCKVVQHGSGDRPLGNPSNGHGYLFRLLIRVSSVPSMVDITLAAASYARW